MGYRFVFIGLIAFLVLCVVGWSSVVVVVDEGQQALIVQFGNVERIINVAGLNFKVPFLQDVVYLDKRIINVNVDSREVIADDQKRFVVDAYAKYKIVDPLKFYQSVRNEVIMEQRLGSILEAQMREQMGKVSLVNLLNEDRGDVMKKIGANVDQTVREFGIKIVDVRIKRADLPEENSSAVFMRMRSDREKEARELRAEGGEMAQRIRSESDKQARIILSDANKDAQMIKGRGDAKATMIYNNVIVKDMDFFNFYRRMQAYDKVIKKDNTKVIMSSKNDFMKLFNFGNHN